MTEFHMRRKSYAVKIGDVTVGGTAPISVQSMTKTDTRDWRATIRQIHALEDAGCEIVRVAVPDKEAAEALSKIKKGARIPVVADIHFNFRLALIAVMQGADCIRLNPGNIYRAGEVREIIESASRRNIPIRIGVNSGSLKSTRRGDPCGRPRVGTSPTPTPGHITARAMVTSALNYIRIMEKSGFHDIIISLKASDVPTTIQAYELMAEKCDYPFHLGITAAGPVRAGSVKSAVGIGALLSKGLGDTIRVSLTGSPKDEVRAAYEILNSLGLRQMMGPEIVSCPTCGRCQVNLIRIVKDVEKNLKKFRLQEKLTGIKIAVMGCPVNGPGEAKEADIGIACGKGKGILFKNGKVLRKVSEGKLVQSLITELRSL